MQSPNCVWLWPRRKRVRTPVALFSSLSEKYPWNGVNPIIPTQLAIGLIISLMFFSRKAIENTDCFSDGVVFSYTDSCTYIHIYAEYTPTQWITDEQGLLYKMICTSHFIVRFERVTQGLRVRGSWRPNRTAIYWPPTLMAVNVVSFSFSRAAQPEAQGPSSLLDNGFLYCILSATFLDPNSIGGPEPLRPGVAFPTTSRL